MDLEKSLRWGVTLSISFLWFEVQGSCVCGGEGEGCPPAVFLSAEHLPRLVECKDAQDKISTFG